MNVKVNGANHELEPATKLGQLIDSLGLDRRFLVVEYNGDPLPREKIEATVLADGDSLELVRPVAGG